jgi:hypothetical protein
MPIKQQILTKPKEDTPEEIAQKQEREKFLFCDIFVNTNFRRKNEPIFALAFCESSRHLKIPKDDLLFKTDEEIFAIIGDIIKQHYIETDGILAVWGKIVNYFYRHTDGNRYRFDTDGNLIIDEKASLN